MLLPDAAEIGRALGYRVRPWARGPPASRPGRARRTTKTKEAREMRRRGETATFPLAGLHTPVPPATDPATMAPPPGRHALLPRFAADAAQAEGIARRVGLTQPARAELGRRGREDDDLHVRPVARGETDLAESLAETAPAHREPAPSVPPQAPLGQVAASRVRFTCGSPAGMPSPTLRPARLQGARPEAAAPRPPGNRRAGRALTRRVLPRTAGVPRSGASGPAAPRRAPLTRGPSPADRATRERPT